MRQKQITKDDAIKIKAKKLATYFHTHNKNLTKCQERLVDELYAVLTDWNYVKKNLKAYSLED